MPVERRSGIISIKKNGVMIWIAPRWAICLAMQIATATNKPHVKRNYTPHRALPANPRVHHRLVELGQALPRRSRYERANHKCCRHQVGISLIDRLSFGLSRSQASWIWPEGSFINMSGFDHVSGPECFKPCPTRRAHDYAL